MIGKVPLLGACDTETAVIAGISRLTALALLGVLSLGAASLSLIGTVQPPPRSAVAAISAVESPFYDEVQLRNGGFSFRGLKPGSYTLTVMDPEWGVTRRTVQVTASFADASGRVRVALDLEQSDGARSRRITQQSTVSLASLQVAPKARSARRKALVRLRKGDEEGAVALLLRAVEISPSFTEVWNELGTISYKAGRYTEAEERFRKALEHEPLAFAPMVNLGGALLSQDRYEEALSFNLMARSMQPEDALANAQLGMNFYYKDQYRKAVEYLLRAKESDPSHFSYPQFFLADIYAKQGNLGEARAELGEIMRLHPDAGAALLAREALRRLDELDPQR